MIEFLIGLSALISFAGIILLFGIIWQFIEYQSFKNMNIYDLFANGIILFGIIVVTFSIIAVLYLVGIFIIQAYHVF